MVVSASASASTGLTSPSSPASAAAASRAPGAGGGCGTVPTVIVMSPARNFDQRCVAHGQRSSTRGARTNQAMAKGQIAKAMN
eukprot:11709457-Alexandrium_andersonii.AAC.2